MPAIDDVYLSSKVAVVRYREMEQAQKVRGLAKFVHDRLFERYITPLLSVPKKKKNGFLIMAACCLLIETLESFYNGWEDNHIGMPRKDVAASCRPTKSMISRSEVAFCYFFQRETAFAPFRPHATAFYKHIRCGILHQGETTGGWLITRRADRPLFSEPGPTINANEFFAAMRASVRTYCKTLIESSWNDDIWINFRKKMAAVVKNCAP
jgi:hypothetical protein